MTHILIPRTPSMNLLRPFIECPTSELDQAWAAMVRIAEVQHARAGRQYPAQIEEPAAPAAVAGPALDVTLDEDQAGLLRDMLGDPAEYEEALTVRLIVCDGHSGHGLYVAQAEYQDEGTVLLAPLPATAAAALEAPAVEERNSQGDLQAAGAAIHAALAAAPQAPAEAQEPAANLHDDGYWTPTKTEAGRALNERLMRAGSPRIPVYTHPAPQQAAPQAPAAPSAYSRSQHDADSRELRSLCIARDAARRERDLVRVEIAGLQASTGHLSALVDNQHALLEKAKATMTDLHGAASPVDESRGDLDARIPASAFARFVDAHAELLHAMAQSPVAGPAAPVAVPWDNFPAYLIDHCEGQTITEEGLQRALSAMLANPQYAAAAPAAPAVDAELLELAQAIVKFNREHGSVLAVHIDNLADLVDERAAQAKEGGEACA